MKKHAIISLLFLVLNLTSYSQDIKNGVYANDHDDVICIKNDTLFYHWWRMYYLGSYKFEDGKYYFGKNALLGMNAFVEKEPCSPDSIEIKMIDKYQIIPIGAPMRDSTIYEGESEFFRIIINGISIKSQDTKGMLISKGQLTDDELTSGFFLESSGWHMSGFQDYFDFPLEYGTRYIIKQKYYRVFHPFLCVGDSNVFNSEYKDYLKIKFKNKGKELLYKTSSPNWDKYVKLEYISPNVDSCFTEFKNRFPLLFE